MSNLDTTETVIVPVISKGFTLIYIRIPVDDYKPSYNPVTQELRQEDVIVDGQLTRVWAVWEATHFLARLLGSNGQRVSD